jgi:predicted amidohydrolase
MFCEKGAIQENMERMIEYMEEAVKFEMDIVVFPEMSLTGYIDPTRMPQAILKVDGPEIQSLLDQTKKYKFTSILGFIEENPLGKPFITQISIQGGAIKALYRKVTIEDEEVLWFDPGNKFQVVRNNDIVYGISVCADLKNKKLFSAYSYQGAKIIFEAAAPGLYGDQSTRDWEEGYKWWEEECRTYLGSFAKQYSLWIVVSTQAGRTVDEDFPGGAYVFSPSGERVYASKNWAVGAAYLKLNLDKGTSTLLGISNL